MSDDTAPSPSPASRGGPPLDAMSFDMLLAKVIGIDPDSASMLTLKDVLKNILIHIRAQSIQINQLKGRLTEENERLTAFDDRWMARLDSLDKAVEGLLKVAGPGTPIFFLASDIRSQITSAKREAVQEVAKAAEDRAEALSDADDDMPF